MQEDLTACPSCGSSRLVSMLGMGFDGCLGCQRFWERLPPGEPYQLDGEPMPFKTPCDNCAFRGKSQERSDPEHWDSLLLSFAHGGEFYCHKGVPMEFDPKTREVKEWLYPRVERTVEFAGQKHTYPGYDTERMRLCRGFLNAYIPRARPE